jgi:hypothetical protein
MARPPSPVIGLKRGRTGITPLGGALAAMPFAPLSPALAQPSRALKRPCATATPRIQQSKPKSKP